MTTKGTSLAAALQVMMRLGYVPDLNNDFLVNGEHIRLDVVDDEVVVKTERGTLPWTVFTRTLRPQ